MRGGIFPDGYLKLMVLPVGLQPTAYRLRKHLRFTKRGNTLFMQMLKVLIPSIICCPTNQPYNYAYHYRLSLSLYAALYK